MDSINQAASALNTGIDSIVQYITDNGVAIGILLLIAYLVRNYVTKNPSLIEAAGGGYVLAQGTSAAQNATSREEELRKVRLHQQELANERAKEAAKLRAEKDAKERERKNYVAKKKYGGTGDQLGGSKTTATDSTSSGFKPLQPLASHHSGYRPPRRNVNSGG